MKCSNKLNLPRVSETHMQEWTSFRKFKNLMEDGKFIVREEGKTDYGVDLNLEVIINEQYASNYRISIQMKDVINSRDKKNKDFSYSYSIPVTTLGYLLNSPNSLVVIYFEDIDTFYWEWTDEINKKANYKNINLNNTPQKSYTYRFNKKLDEVSKKELHKEIILRAKQIKEFNKMKKGIKNKGNDHSDLNISVNSEKTKKALKLYLNIIDNENKLKNLMMMSQYTPRELKHALTEGIMTARLADGIMELIEIDLQVLIGSRDLSIFDTNKLIR